MYLHYSILSMMYVVFAVLITIAAPIMAILKQPPGCAIKAVRNGACITEWVQFRFLAYRKRTIVWHFFLMMAMRLDWFSLRDSWIMTKQSGDPGVFVFVKEGHCFQHWALESSIDGAGKPLTAFHYARSKKWCKLFSVHVELGWDFPGDTGAAFVFRVWPFASADDWLGPVDDERGQKGW